MAKGEITLKLQDPLINVGVLALSLCSTVDGLTEQLRDENGEPDNDAIRTSIKSTSVLRSIYEQSEEWLNDHSYNQAERELFAEKIVPEVAKMYNKAVKRIEEVTGMKMNEWLRKDKLSVAEAFIRKKLEEQDKDILDILDIDDDEDEDVKIHVVRVTDKNSKSKTKNNFRRLLLAAIEDEDDEDEEDDDDTVD